MPRRQHDRQYDLVVFGATGYTGKYAVQYITTDLPTDLKWAVAGRSQSKLEKVVAECQKLNPDRAPPSIEICNLNDIDLSNLAKKTFILITTVGPYGQYGEHAFKACAENGTHYFDVTGEVPFVAKMIKKYEAAAKESGAVMLPQIGVESAPADLITYSLASFIREEYSSPTADVTLSIHNLKSSPSGGTLRTVFTLLNNFTLSDVRAAYEPYALSPVPPAKPPPSLPIFTRLTGLIQVPFLGLLTTSVAGSTDAAIVHRSWGIFAKYPALWLRGRQQNDAERSTSYGPNFSFREFMRSRNWLTGLGIHIGLLLLGLVMVTPFLRELAAKWVVQPGDGPDPETAKFDELEYRGIATADGKKKRALCRAWFMGSPYYLTGILLAEAARTLLEEEVELPGGIYTAACLGQPFIDRLERAGFHLETKCLEH